MKLVYKNIIINTILSIFILFIGEYSIYFFLKNKIEKETIEHLMFESHVLKLKLKSGISIDAFKNNIGDELEIKPITSIQINSPIIEDVMVIEQEDEHEEEHEVEGKFSSKKITFDVTQNNDHYRVSIIKTVDEDEGLAGSMFAIIFISSLCMLVILVVVNLYVYYKLFSPLYQLIRDVKGFSVQQLQKITPSKTSTKEFIELGEEVSKMSEKMISDYTSMKEFTENITHEIQTPLAVINSKIERCIQDENLTNEQAVLLTDASKAVNKLFNINKGLTLLCKIDNKQYNTPKEINITRLIQQRIHFFIDFIENKKIKLIENYTNEITVLMDVSLSEILIDNLLKNAIQHNFQDGKIFITVQNNQLIIANSGEVPTESTDKSFNRFYSQKPHQSLGLGLSIIKKIVDYYGYNMSYNYMHDLHEVTINFK